MGRIVPNGVLAPYDPKEKDAFTAGWQAARAYFVDHDWGPAPPSTPEAAKAQWEQTCDEGHVVRIDDCVACRRMIRKP